MTSAKPILAVGGVGGSGTRVVSDILQRCGVFFGNDQNGSKDTLPFTLFFNIEALKLLPAEFSVRANLCRKCLHQEAITQSEEEFLKQQVNYNQLHHKKEWLMERVQRILNSGHALHPERWGCKSPPTHFFAKQFLDCWTDFKFIMVIRAGGLVMNCCVTREFGVSGSAKTTYSQHFGFNGQAARMIPNGPVSPGDLFVFYGLLKQGASGMPQDINLEAAGEFLAPCRFKAEMYDLGGFPGVVTGETLCHGVRYRLNDASLIDALDSFEDVLPDDPERSLYQRVQIDLFDNEVQPTGETAWIYWYNQPVTGFKKREDGNWPLSAGKTRK